MVPPIPFAQDDRKWLNGDAKTFFSLSIINKKKG